MGSRSVAQQIFAAESGFAQSMADRDFDGFASHVAPDAVFFARASVQRGKAAVLDAWRGFFDGPDAPFSWRPETIEVLASGRLKRPSAPRKTSGRTRFATGAALMRNFMCLS